MDFTREPIIETVISAKEGHKLLVRSSKISGAEEYNVDAVEVISFGSVQFFRAQEKPRPFLVPVTDYEVLEVREMRLPIKSANHERAIKIAPKKEGGKKPKAQEKTKEKAKEKAEEKADEKAEEGDAKKKRTRRRTRRKKGEDAEAPEADEVVDSGEEKAEETPPPRKPLVPPPTTLISETISRYKDILMGEEEGKVEPPELPKELQEEEAKSE